MAATAIYDDFISLFTWEAGAQKCAVFEKQVRSFCAVFLQPNLRHKTQTTHHQ
jgi:hypothetical protein